MPREGAVRVRRIVFAVAVAICLIRPAIALVVELPGSPVVREIAGAPPSISLRPAYLDAIRAQAPDGNVLLGFELPEGAEELAASIYYQCTYDLHPRRVFVTDEPAVINDGRDLLRVARAPDPEWLAAHAVDWRVEIAAAGGGLQLLVRPVQAP